MTAAHPGTQAFVGRRSFLRLAGVAGLGGVGVLNACGGPRPPAPEPDASANVPRVVASGFSTPWSMVRLRDGGFLVSERDTALLKTLETDRSPRVFAEVPGVVPGGEGGLLGLEVLQSNDREWLYAYTSTESDNRVLRFELHPDGLGTAQSIIDGIPRAAIHNGGRLKFGPDGLLYIGTGDATDQAAAQDPEALNGKILRLNPDGSIPAGNPLPGSAVYSHGHRNVQGLAWDSSGRLWASELGPDRDDELNLVVPGGNYGWPEVTGAPHQEGFLDAVHVWISTAEASPSALAILRGTAYVACLRGERLWQLGLPPGEPATRGTLPDAQVALAGQGRLRDVIAVSESELWIATNEDVNSRIISLSV